MEAKGPWQKFLSAATRSITISLDNEVDHP